MLLADPSIDVGALAALLQDEFGADASPSFVPVGGDSWDPLRGGLYALALA